MHQADPPQHPGAAPRPPDEHVPEAAFGVLDRTLGRRDALKAAALVAAGAVAPAAAPQAARAASPVPRAATSPRVLQPGRGPGIRGRYLPSDPTQVRWGSLPNRRSAAVMTVDSGTVVTIDTVSHEGILEDQGRDPVAYFREQGVAADAVLRDAVAIAGSSIEHDFDDDGPHVVTGPVAVRGARPGDVLRVDVLALRPRVPYGVISNRHGKGALPGEFPENDGPRKGASSRFPERYANVSTFTPVTRRGGQLRGRLDGGARYDLDFPLDPFMGMMGVALDTAATVNSVPPTKAGGNVDIKDLTVGSRFYLPVFVPEARFYVGDPHFAQGNGEVALTALEASLRGTFRLTLLKAGDPAIPGNRKSLELPVGETAEYWIPVGLDEDLDEAMKEAVRQAIALLQGEYGVPRAVAYAYLSAAGDFVVSQVVDKTKGVHGLLRKSDLRRT